MFVTDALAELHGDRNVTSTANGRANDVPIEVCAKRQSRPSTITSHLGRGTSEVEIDVISFDLRHQIVDGLADEVGIGSIQLYGSRRLVVWERCKQPGLLITLDERPGADHLTDVDPGTELPTQPSKRRVRHTRHGREHDRRINGQRPDLKGVGYHGGKGTGTRASQLTADG
jgi:hypothetical protein